MECSNVRKFLENGILGYFLTFQFLLLLFTIVLYTTTTRYTSKRFASKKFLFFFVKVIILRVPLVLLQLQTHFF